MDVNQAKQNQAEAQAAAKAVVSAYKQVFGVDGARTDAQRIVWEDMKARARIESPIFVAGADGSLCPMRAAFADGQRTMVIQISEILRSREEQAKTVEVKR